MNREQIIQMAQEAGIRFRRDVFHSGYCDGVHGDELEAFAKLVIKPWADQLEVERKKFQELNDIAVVGMQHARIAEREACAKVCEENATDLSEGDWDSACLNCADHIRERGQA